MFLVFFLFKALVIDMKFSILALITVVSVLSTRDAAGAPLPALMIRETGKNNHAAAALLNVNGRQTTNNHDEKQEKK
ncbi:SubName: Full=Uncharacterized protein {ECO:0000313/EMBL:CCA77188.1} [Serendipita indica DSM 11827]|nr:SubName: Full=Uncharacterized protein {ECO:0000313/EMBL:CCA77188.1} [Serendipita indica DSM 11827]